MNPEFRRNLWLEFSDQRLVAMPVIMGALFLLAFLFNGRELDQHTGMVASFTYIVLIFLWGTRLAAESVLHEVNNRTWDLQRMSAIGAWQMAWGKLFGATAYAWYGAFICLGFYVVSFEGIMSPDALLIAILLYIGSGVMAHAICPCGESASHSTQACLWPSPGDVLPVSWALMRFTAAIFRARRIRQRWCLPSDDLVWRGVSAFHCDVARSGGLRGVGINRCVRPHAG